MSCEASASLLERWPLEDGHNQLLGGGVGVDIVYSDTLTCYSSITPGYWTRNKHYGSRGRHCVKSMAE